MAALLILVALGLAALASGVATALTSRIESPAARLTIGIGVACLVGVAAAAGLWALFDSNG